MIIPIPNLSVNLTLSGKSKQLDNKDEHAQSRAPLQMPYTVDPVVFMLLTAIVLLSGAMLVYAARS
jgi:hypothetical protein